MLVFKQTSVGSMATRVPSLGLNFWKRGGSVPFDCAMVVLKCCWIWWWKIKTGLEEKIQGFCPPLFVVCEC